MTTKQREEIEKLDRWLAVAEVIGRRFYVVGSRVISFEDSCTIHAYAVENGYRLAGKVPLPEKIRCALYNANDKNKGSPGAVRAKLHQLYPFLTETPAPTEVPAHV